MSALTCVLLVQATATLMMAGLIWFVQIVHYPLFRDVGAEGYRRFQQEHMRRTSVVVLPLMLAELAAAISLVPLSPTPPFRGLAWTGLVALGLLWLSTFGWQVPCHRRLESGFDEMAWRRLVRTNWLRTGLWSLRGAVALAMLSTVMVR